MNGARRPRYGQMDPVIHMRDAHPQAIGAIPPTTVPASKIMAGVYSLYPASIRSQLENKQYARHTVKTNVADWLH